MGNLCCGPDEDENSKNLPLMRARVERMKLTTPSITTAIHLNQTSTVRLDASTVDKDRTIEINWFTPEEKIAFDAALDSIMSKRVTAKNALSATHWKTSENYSAEGEFPGGDYYVAARSSSVTRDKNVCLDIKLTITPVKTGDRSPKGPK